MTLQHATSLGYRPEEDGGWGMRTVMVAKQKGGVGATTVARELVGHLPRNLPFLAAASVGW